MKELPTIQRNLIPVIQLNAKESLSRIAKLCGTGESAVRYHMKRLQDAGLIREAPFINVYPLGYRYVNLYFSLSTANSAAVDAFLKALVASTHVTWLAELGGDFHFGISLLVKEVEEIRDILDSFSKKFPDIFFEKSFVFHTALQVFPAKYLTSRKLSWNPLGYGPTGGKFEADKLDKSIITTMAARGLTSGRAIARELGEPHATIENRLRRLEKEGVIAGYWNLFDCSKLGYQTLKLLIYAKGHQHSLSAQLLAFAREEPHISYYIECLGSWDFELGLDVEEQIEVAAVSRKILDAFGNAINTIKVVPMFRVLKWRQFSDG